MAIFQRYENLLALILFCSFVTKGSWSQRLPCSQITTCHTAGGTICDRARGQCPACIYDRGNGEFSCIEEIDGICGFGNAVLAVCPNPLESDENDVNPNVVQAPTETPSTDSPTSLPTEEEVVSESFEATSETSNNELNSKVNLDNVGASKTSSDGSANTLLLVLSPVVLVAFLIGAIWYRRKQLSKRETQEAPLEPHTSTKRKKMPHAVVVIAPSSYDNDEDEMLSATSESLSGYDSLEDEGIYAPSATYSLSSMPAVKEIQKENQPFML